MVVRKTGLPRYPLASNARAGGQIIAGLLERLSGQLKVPAGGRGKSLSAFYQLFSGPGKLYRGLHIPARWFQTPCRWFETLVRLLETLVAFLQTRPRACRYFPACPAETGECSTVFATDLAGPTSPATSLPNALPSLSINLPGISTTLP